jgi:hypothetical protein
MTNTDYSIVEYYAEHEGYRCGYCKSADTNYSHGKWHIEICLYGREVSFLFD